MPSVDAMQLERRRKLFEAMGNQAIAGSPTQMVSGRAVPQGLGQGMTRLAQAYMASKGMKGAEEGLSKGRSEASQRVIDAMTGSPQAGGPIRPEMMGEEGYQPFTPAVEPDYQKAALTAATDPYLAQDKGLQGITQAMLKAKAGGGGSSQFYTYQPNAAGELVRLPGRPGEEPGMVSVGGKSVTPAKWSPTMQQAVSGGKETGKLESQLELKPQVEGAVVTAKKEAEYEEGNRQRRESMPGMVTMARTILETGEPTASGIGTAYDYAASMFGFSPEGAAAADQLKAIGGGLTSKMPRMEGPQSDKDILLYREMAGQVGNSTLPTERRLAALEIVESMWSKPPGTSYDDFKSGKTTQTGTGNAPEDVPADVWDVMTDDEKALWL